MKAVFTEPRFYKGCEDYLYLFLHMATKSMCEAVVEGMGGMWDRSDRHGDFRTATLEAVVAWSAPPPYHPAAVPFINRSLAHLFGNDIWMNHEEVSLTTTTTTSIERASALGKGQVMSRKKRETLRLPTSFYE